METTTQAYDERNDFLSLARKYNEQAEIWRKKANSIIPENAEDYYDKGIHLFRQKLYKESIKALDQATNLNSEHWEAYKVKSYCFEELDQIQEAEQINIILKNANQKPYGKQIDINLENSQKNLDKNPNCPKSHYEMARVLESTGYYEEAIKHCDTALEIDSLRAEAYNAKGYCLYRLGKTQEALTCFNEAIHLKPDYVDVYFKIANLYSHLSLVYYENANKRYDSLLKSDSKNPVLYFNKAIASTALGRNLEAILFYERAIELEPSDTDAYINKISLLFSLGYDIDPDLSDSWRRPKITKKQILSIQPNCICSKNTHRKIVKNKQQQKQLLLKTANDLLSRAISGYFFSSDPPKNPYMLWAWGYTLHLCVEHFLKWYCCINNINPTSTHCLTCLLKESNLKLKASTIEDINYINLLEDRYKIIEVGTEYIKKAHNIILDIILQVPTDDYKRFRKNYFAVFLFQ